jgi:hypothetical protein
LQLAEQQACHFDWQSPVVVERTVSNQLLQPVDQLKAIGMWCAAFNQLEDRKVLNLFATGKPEVKR